MSEDRLRVLLVDDEVSLREPLARYLGDNFGYQVDPVASGEEALRQAEARQGRYDVALIDEVLMPGPDGIQVMQEIKARYPGIECIIFTGWGKDSALRALREGAYRYLAKPFDVDELGMIIRTAAQQVRLRDISRAILSERDPDRVLKSIVGAACSLALADEAAIVLLDRATEKLQVHAETYSAERQWRRHFKDQDLSRQIIQTGQMERIPDTTQDGRVNPQVIEAGIRSFVGLPIPSTNGNLGVLYVYSQRPGRFEEGGTVAVLQTLAGQAGLAIVNAQAFQQVRAHAGYMEALVRVGQGLTRTTKLEDQLALARDFVRERLQVSTFYVALYDRRNETLRFPLAYDMGQPIGISDRPLGEDPAEWGISGYVVKTGQELYWPTSEDEQRQCRDLGLQPVRVGRPPASESCFYFPLKTGDEVTGVISIQSHERHAFSSILQNAFRALGSQLAVALENARLFAAEARQRQEAEALREATLSLTTTLEEQEIFERILSELQKVVPYDSASVQILKGDQLEIIGGRGFPNLPELLGISFPIDGDNPNREVVRRRKPFIVPDAPAVYKGFTQEPHVQAGIRGWLGVPMLVGDRLIGMIALDKRQPGFYTEEHGRLAETFAAQAALAVENARLMTKTRRWAASLETLQRRSATIASSLELDQVLREACQAAVELFDVDHSGLVIFEPEYGRGKVVAEYPAKGTLGIEIPLSRVPAEKQLIATRDPLILSDVSKESGLGPVLDIFRQFDIRSILIVPVIIKDQVWGSFSLDAIGRWRTFTQEDVELCKSFAAVVAVASENARLFQEAQEGQVLLRSVYQAGNTLISKPDPEQVLRAIVKQARKALRAWRASVVLLDEMGRPQRLAAVGFDKKLRVDTVIRENGLSMRVVRTGQPIIIEDIACRKGEINPGMLKDGVGAAICLPLSLRGKNIGVVWLHYREPRRFSEAESEALRIYTAQAAIAYDNARRMRELEHMRRAAEAMAGALELHQVLEQIVKSARDVLQADSAAIWSYDDARNQFIPEELVSAGIPKRKLERFRKTEPKTGGTADTVMRRGWVRVADIQDPATYDFMMGHSTKELLESIGARSFQGVALRVGNENLGVLYVNYDRPRSFSEEERQTLETFATHAALALKKARLLKQMDRTTEAAQVVARVTVAENLRQTLQTIVQNVQETLGSDVVTLYAYDEERNRFWEWATMPERLESARPPEKLDPPSVIWEILKLKDPPYRFAEDGASADRILGGRFVRTEGMRAATGIRLKAGDQRVGVMFVNYRSPHRFTSDELATIMLFADQAAVAIRNAHLYGELQQRANILETLYDAGRTITASLDLDTTLDQILHQARRLTGRRGKEACFGDIMLVDGDNKLRFAAAFPEGALERLRQQIGPGVDLSKGVGGRIGITGRTARTGQSQLVKDVTQDPDFYPAHDKETRSELSVPIKIGGEIIGVINVEHPDLNAFDEEDQKALEALAAQAAIAIQNARQYEELKRTKGLVGARTALAWMGMASSAWGHGVRTLAATIRGQVKLLRLDLQRSLSPEQFTRVENRLSMIENAAHEISTRPITPPLSAEEGASLVAVNDLIGERVGQLWQKEPYQAAHLQLDLRLDDAAAVWASREWLRRAFDIVVDNAVEAVADREVRQVTITTRQVGNDIEIVISDTGPGIAEDVLPRLFQEPIQRPDQTKGWGMGLLMAQAIVQTYEGEIRIGHTGPMGTTMILCLPRAA